MVRRITYIFPLFLVLTGLALYAQAHEVEPLRTVIIQVETDRVDIMVLFEEPPGSRAGLFLAKYDIDQNGQIEGPEAELAGREMLPRMLAGLQFEVVGERPGTGEPEIKFVVTPTKGITAAAFVSYQLPDLLTEGTRTVAVRNLRANQGMPAEVLIRAGSDLQITTASVPHTGGLATQPFTLAPGDEATAGIAHVQAVPTEVSGR